MANKLKSTAVNVEMSLIAKGILVKKICKTAWEVRNFNTNMPAKYNLLFSKLPYAIGTKYLDSLN